MSKEVRRRLSEERFEIRRKVTEMKETEKRRYFGNAGCSGIANSKRSANLVQPPNPQVSNRREAEALMKDIRQSPFTHPGGHAQVGDVDWRVGICFKEAFDAVQNTLSRRYPVVRRRGMFRSEQSRRQSWQCSVHPEFQLRAVSGRVVKHSWKMAQKSVNGGDREWRGWQNSRRRSRLFEIVKAEIVGRPADCIRIDRQHHQFEVRRHPYDVR